MSFDKEEMELDPADFYNGVYNLKKAGVVVELSDEQKDELKKCILDPMYFIENYCYITSLDKGTTLFKPFEYQKRAIKNIMGNRFCILKQPRQMGKCLKYDVNIKVRNKNTKEIKTLPIGELYEQVQQNSRRKRDDQTSN